MKIGALNNNVSFGRALSTKELKEFKKVTDEAKQQLGLDKTVATIFDFSVPTEKYDTGIGTTNSEDAQKMVSMLQSLCGINAIQVQPQGQISNFNRSPYSGTNFSLGEHTIDLTKLADSKYGNILTEEDLQCDFMNRSASPSAVDYTNIFRQDGQKAMLKKAYTRFKELDESDPLKKGFEKFKKQNEYWLERDALFEAAVVDNDEPDAAGWPERDQNIFATEEIDTERIAELKTVEDKQGNNIVDFEEFVQYIADKQQREAKKEYNKKGIDVYGDCLIGFSQKDVWAHKSAFTDGLYYGCKNDDGSYSCWTPALDYGKLDGEAGELLQQKFDKFFERYNGVRIDAAWQLINPVICEPVDDGNGGITGVAIDNQPVIPDDGKYIINNIILKAADKNNVPHDKVMMELLGGEAWKSVDAAKEAGTTLIHITRYGQPKWGRVKYYESQGTDTYQNMRPGEYIIGPGTHDDESLVNMAQNGEARAKYLAKDLHMDKNILAESASARAEAITAELYTTKNQFMTLPDILGSRKRINTPETIKGNWLYRAEPNYETQYYKNIEKGRGLNFANALSRALKAKNGGKSSDLTNRLDEFDFILREKGPMTTKEADKFVGRA